MPKTAVLVLLCTLLCAFLGGCGKEIQKKEPPSLSPQQSVTDNTPAPPVSDPDIVSDLAIQDFMSIEDSSWIREYPVEMVVVHFCSNVVIDRSNPYSLQAIRSTFVTNEVSINYIIDRDGTIYCWIPEQRVAWHAGKGSYGEEKYTNSLNKYSIGIELLAMGSKKDMSQYLSSKVYSSIPKELIGYTDAQYNALSGLISDITDRWGIPKDRQHIIGHDEYNPQQLGYL